MVEIILPQPNKPDIYSFGFDKNLIKEKLKQGTPLVYDIVDEKVAPPLISSGLLEMNSAGEVTMKAASMGGSTLQYTISNQGYFSFGDGSDSDAVLTGNTTLTADRYYDNLTVNNGVVLTPAGYRIFVRNTLNLYGTIRWNGNAGSAGGIGGSPDFLCNGNAGGTGGGGGAALADGYLKGSVAGAAGGAGGAGSCTSAGCTAANAGTAGTGGTATSNSIGSVGTAGTVGGTGGSSDCGGGGTGGAGGSAGGATASNVKLIANWHLATLLDIGSTGSVVKFDNSGGGAGSGGGGGGRGSNTVAPNEGAGGGGGGGGGAGSSGGIIAIYAKKIIIYTTGLIESNGGAGGNGGGGGTAGVEGTGKAGGGGGGSGGAGGNGGQIVLVYNEIKELGNVQAKGGIGGTLGAAGSGAGGGANGVAGTNGATGTAGTIRRFLISL